MRLKGKPVALITMILADLWVIGSSLYYLIARGSITSDESNAIITVGAFIALIPTPVNLSLIIRNLKGLPDTETPPTDPSTTLGVTDKEGK